MPGVNGRTRFVEKLSAIRCTNNYHSFAIMDILFTSTNYDDSEMIANTDQKGWQS